MAILITGAAGLIGYHLSQRLLRQQHELVVLDNLSTGSLHHWQLLQQSPHVFCLEQDVEQPILCGQIPHQLTAIYHLAAPASPLAYQKKPVSTLDTCVLGSRAMLQLAHQHQCPLLLASTSEVYGDPTVHPQPEHYWGHVNPFGPRACYDEGKRCAEAYAWAFAQQLGVSIRVARIFNTYGPGMRWDDGRIISNLLAQGLQGQPLTIYGRGQQTRSFCYVDDMVCGLQLLMASHVTTPINLGQEEECSILSLAQHIQQLFEPRPPLVFLPLPQDDPQQRRPDLTLARQLLGYAPKITLEEGLLATFNWFAAHLGTQVPRQTLATGTTHACAQELS